MAIAALAALALTIAVQAQTATNPNPNLIISWSFNQYGFINAVGGSGLPVTNTEAGLAAAYNWNDSWAENSSTYAYGNPVTVSNLFDDTGAATAVNLTYNAYNGYRVQASNPAQDANGTYNKDMLNGFLNAGPASWGPPTTNTSVSLTNIPYPLYDVVVYFNSDTSGRHSTISDGKTTYSFSTVGGPSISGANAFFQPTTETNSSVFPGADFAFFRGETNANVTFTTYPKSGNDQWLGIAAVQVIQASNVYVLYGPSPASQIVTVGQPAGFSVMAGGLNPHYQWQHAGTNLLNATNATYSIATTVPGQDGNYDVIVSNNFSSVTSVVATLTLYTPKTIEWDGNGSTWDTTSLFWTLNGGASTTNYTETDNVRFGPLGSARSAVTLAGTFSPTSVTVSNANYTLTGGGLDGSASLHVMNNGQLILDAADTSTGPALIDPGSVLQLDNGDAAGALGAGALTNNGGLLFNSSADYAYGYPIYGTGSVTNNGSAGQITLANTVNANYLVQSGAGSMLLQGNNNISGGLIVANGTLLARAAGCLASNTIVTANGQLQLIFNIAFTGGNITLDGGFLIGGVSGNDSYDGTVTLAADSEIDVQSADTLTLSNAFGISASGYNLYTGGGGTLILAGTNNTWGGLNITLGTVQIGNGGGGSLGAGTIDDAGTLAFNTAGNLIVPNTITDIGNINQNGPGTVVFTGDLSTLSGTTTVAAGGLGGTATFGGPIVVLSGGTLAPGTPSAIGTLTVNNSLTLGGNVSVKVNKSLAQSNDLVSVTGTLSNTNNGVVIVNNLGPALAAGDKFTLFSQPVSGGGLLSVTGGGVVWSNNLANDGSIIVLSATAPHPVIRNITLSGGNVVVSGTNGAASGTCYLLSSTNLATPLANWVRVSTNSFDSSGNFNITNAVGGARQKFYILQSQ